MGLTHRVAGLWRTKAATHQVEGMQVAVPDPGGAQIERDRRSIPQIGMPGAAVRHGKMEEWICVLKILPDFTKGIHDRVLVSDPQAVQRIKVTEN